MDIVLLILSPALVGLATIVLMRRITRRRDPDGTGGSGITLSLTIAIAAMLCVLLLQAPGYGGQGQAALISLIVTLYSVSCGALGAALTLTPLPRALGFAVALLAPLTYWIWG
ncbi:hypothetical protein C4N9_17355 [Pararhodobacter marinus]|uniref:Uncharacterized protein n=1 Tax=Pararhodobacter marinus TaxID=2184063 RepID=A0A2U2C6D9_9RHOB|nr:hypothetical protein [Pararhodobacter marinus]PWE27422.1 hypothetical protein C4N9_17355 [Pararhodobacter marinus]